jgi:hypothetical protein
LNDSQIFKNCCESFGLPIPVSELKFHADRQWKFDYAWPSEKVALEVEGGIFGRGRPCPLCKRKKPGAHSSIERLISDMEKYNAAAADGWRIIRVIPDDLLKVKTMEVLLLTLNL